jgi:hypothetical protein
MARASNKKFCMKYQIEPMGSPKFGRYESVFSVVILFSSLRLTQQRSPLEEPRGKVTRTSR